MIKSAVDLVEPAVHFTEFTVYLIELLFCFRLEREQVLVRALDLLTQESERAFEFAHAALQIANLGFDAHRCRVSATKRNSVTLKQATIRIPGRISMLPRCRRVATPA